MGYSCAAKAAYVRDAITEHFHSLGIESSNGLPDGGFWETGREQDDGAIVGTVFKCVRRYTPEERAAKAVEMSRNGVVCKPEWIGDPCRRAGSFKIDAEGVIVRFPGIDAKTRKVLESKGAAEFKRIHGDWR